MNIKLIYDYGSNWGIFSRFMWMLPNAIPYDVEKINFTSMNGDSNPYDWIFDQGVDDSFIEIECQHLGSYTPSQKGKIEKHNEFDKLRLLVSKIKIKKYILDWVDDNDFGKNCLGVHIRLGDMNSHHPELGVANINDYINKIETILETESFDKIFIASDNHQSIKDLQKHFSSHEILFILGFARARKDNFNTMSDCIDIKKLVYWEEAFKECLLLSKSRQLLCRVSNLAHASMLFSNTYTKIHRVNEF